jgi:hypothetical protein
VLRAEVAREVAGSAERLAAAFHDANVRDAAEVVLQVTRQLLRLGEDARAAFNGALELLEKVEAAVASQVARSAEALGARADGALVRLLTRVGLHVLTQGELALEAASARGHGALERALALLRRRRRGSGGSSGSGSGGGSSGVLGVVHGDVENGFNCFASVGGHGRVDRCEAEGKFESELTRVAAFGPRIRRRACPALEPLTGPLLPPLLVRCDLAPSSRAVPAGWFACLVRAPRQGLNGLEAGSQAVCGSPCRDVELVVLSSKSPRRIAGRRT